LQNVALATERAHLTTEAAGQIARQARVRRVEPFHFSTRYAGQHQRMQDEVMAAFTGHSHRIILTLTHCTDSVLTNKTRKLRSSEPIPLFSESMAKDLRLTALKASGLQQFK
jgi:hypothetical protein